MPWSLMCRAVSLFVCSASDTTYAPSKAPDVNTCFLRALVARFAVLFGVEVLEDQLPPCSRRQSRPPSTGGYRADPATSSRTDKRRPVRSYNQESLSSNLRGQLRDHGLKPIGRFWQGTVRNR